MKFSQLDPYTLQVDDTVDTTATYDFDALVSKRMAAIDALNFEVKRRKEEIATLDLLISQAQSLGIVSKAATVAASVVGDIAAVSSTIVKG